MYQLKNYCIYSIITILIYYSYNIYYTITTTFTNYNLFSRGSPSIKQCFVSRTPELHYSSTLEC